VFSKKLSFETSSHFDKYIVERNPFSKKKMLLENFSVHSQNLVLSTVLSERLPLDTLPDEIVFSFSQNSYVIYIQTEESMKNFVLLF
jgi:hypothetical protein